MPTIDQLAPATAASDTDEMLVSQNGIARKITRAQILAGVQPEIALASGVLLGRASSGTGAPESLEIGANLQLSGGMLSATAQPYSVAALPAGTVPVAADLVPLAQGGANIAVPYAQFMSGIPGVSNLDASKMLVTPTGTGVGTTLADFASGAMQLAGATMTGVLTLAADPQASLQAATKQYVDAQTAAALPKTGGTMSGAIVLAADPAAAMQPATKQYVDAETTACAATVAAETTARASGDAANAAAAAAAQTTANGALPKAGGTMTGAITQAATHQFWSQNGEIIDRFGGRVFVGGATAGDGAYPSVSQDWLTALGAVSYNGGAGVDSNGTASQAAILTDAANGSPACALTVGAQSLLLTSTHSTVYPLNIVAVNNNTTLATAVSGTYLEAHRVNNVVGETTGMEIEVRNSGSSTVHDPFNSLQTGQVSALQLGAGAGLSAAGQANVGYAVSIFANPMQFNAGLLFFEGSLAAAQPGGATTAIGMPVLYELDWFSGAGTISARLYGDSSDALVVEASGGLKVSGPVVLPADPTAALEAVTKQYVDAGVSAALPNTVAALTALIVTLPTTLPGTSGKLWLNGGILCVS
jgi:hypothetical protein